MHGKASEMLVEHATLSEAAGLLGKGGSCQCGLVAEGQQGPFQTIFPTIIFPY